MNTVLYIFGNGSELTTLQMAMRAIVVFVFSLVLIRISGRRSFGMGTSYDNIIIILLGSVLGRAIAGASPFWATIAASFVLVVLHRLTGMWIVKSRRLAGLVEGHKILLYDKGKFLENNMIRALVRKEDVMHSLRKITRAEQLDVVESVYMERNGEITVTLKSNLNELPS